MRNAGFTECFSMLENRHGNSPPCRRQFACGATFFLFLTAYLALVNFVFFSPII